MLEPGRNDEWVAALPFSAANSLFGRLSIVGGTLTLTTDLVIFTPLLGLGRTQRFPLREIDKVAAFADNPPRLKIRFRTRRPLVLMVAPTRTTTIFTQDSSARDEAVASISQRLRNI